MLFIPIFDFLGVKPSVKWKVRSWEGVQTCAAGFDFQEEGHQSILCPWQQQWGITLLDWVISFGVETPDDHLGDP